MENNVYRKVGDKYEPFGVSLNRDWLGDGIWYVRHRDGRKSISNLKHIKDLCGIKKIAECPEKINITKIIQQYDFADDILSSKELNDWLNNRYTYTISELVHKIVEIIINKENAEF